MKIEARAVALLRLGKKRKHICSCEQCSHVPFTRWAAGFMRGRVTDTYQDKWKLGAPLRQPAGSKERACVVVGSIIDRVVLLCFDRLWKSI